MRDPFITEDEWWILRDLANQKCPFHLGMQGPCLHYTLGKIAGLEIRVTGNSLVPYPEDKDPLGRKVERKDGTRGEAARKE
jgi:hypothetical protein